MTRVLDIGDYPNGECEEDIVGGIITHHCYCCDCGLAHECTIRIKGKTAYMSAERMERSTAQMRRHGTPELIGATDGKWKMVKRKRRG